ncbi:MULTISPECIES: carboxymuconolactone decarboxylase family protein [Shewanella]|uniref:Carboxymuconolactone decarboxylase family protein n=1 Tax=Shewanella indica TaxID=768528 RepID=A0ABU4QG68_9GAMM|nr:MULTISPECIES: carboxymuconolactone decarboxylase family protein [Shewanella]MDX6018419.1 carboxymuconolactone decarboxylase family protein [Shewanella indica]NDO74363.1 carboxymuconolactone decarboxylase family protein [Shewanella sp. SE1]TVP12440.1 alkylhydroperoxidase [Shewanella sp. MSW]BCV37170.1 hypothetical protein TUM17377_24980 [Shewanella chilikensis]
MMKRLNYANAAPQALELLYQQERYFHHQFSSSKTMSITIWELVKLRVSQINQCAFCIDMHSKDALKYGEKAERIFGLNAWRDMPIYSTAEGIALGWAEQLTAGLGVSDEEYQQVLDCFGPQAMTDLTIAINAINSWNRIVKVFKPEVGNYQPK